MLIGRSREGDQLRASLGGHHGICVVSGPAGIGKTSLLREVIDADSLWVLGLATAQTRFGDALLVTLPRVSGSPERDASQLLRRLGGRRLVLDDAHWLDPYTLEVVELVATATQPVATWRTADPSAPSSPPRHWHRLALGPLSATDARALACHSRPGLTASELDQVVEVADGSPLLIQELAAGPTPAPNVASALLGRVRTLSKATRSAVLLLAAAEGGLLETMIDPSVHDELRRSGLAVVVEGSWRLRHTLLQESILEVVGPTMVRDAHATLAGLLAPHAPAVAARHADRAGQHDVAIALGEQAVAAANDPIASARASLALADLLEPQLPERAWRLRVAATSELRTCEAFREVVAALDGRTIPIGDAEVHGMARVNLGGAMWALGENDQALDHAERGLDVVQGTGSEAELLLHAGLAMYLGRVRFDGASALVHARAALAIAQRRGQHVIFARTRIAAALLASGDPGWQPEIDSAIADAVATGDVHGERLAREARHIHAFVTGALDTSLSDLAFLTDEADRADLTAGHRALRLLIELLSLGDRAEITTGAERLLAEEPFFIQRSVAVAAGAVAALDQGRADIAHRLLAIDDPADPEELVVIRWARTELAWATGQRPAFPDLVVGAAPILAVHPGTTMTEVMQAWCAFESGDEVPRPPVMTLPGFAPAASEVEALRSLATGQHHAAVEGFDDAALRWRAGSDRRAVLRCRWGAALAADRSGSPDVLDRLDQCWAEATASGSAPISTRAACVLRPHGVHKPPYPVSADPPLSGPQTQTLRLLATGFTTKQVAMLLGLHSGTIDDHLHQAQDRLGARTRADALRWIEERE